jgi:hypothetical protein
MSWVCPYQEDQDNAHEDDGQVVFLPSPSLVIHRHLEEQFILNILKNQIENWIKIFDLNNQNPSLLTNINTMLIILPTYTLDQGVDLIKLF